MNRLLFDVIAALILGVTAVLGASGRCHGGFDC